jgi:hypothetical protein
LEIPALRDNMPPQEVDIPMAKPKPPPAPSKPAPAKPVVPAPQRPSLGSLPARPDHVIRNMTRDEARQVLSTRRAG